MSPEEQEHFDRMVHTALGYPELIELVGGPYCGATLHPHDQEIKSPTDGVVLPFNFSPLEDDVVVMIGPVGSAVYTWRDDFRWVYDAELSMNF